MDSTLSRRRFFSSIGAAAMGMPFAQALGGCARESRRSEVPNVVMLIMDTLRPDVLGCYGFSERTSPELDSVAAQGALFEHVIAPSSWTPTSIGGLLSSRHPRTLGLYTKHNYFADIYARLPHLLRDHGYRTVGITANPMIDACAGFAHGFDQYIDAVVSYEGGVRRLESCDRIFHKALQLVDEQSTEPVFLQINIMEMHDYCLEEGKLTRPEFLGEFKHVPNTANRRDYLQAMRQVSVDAAQFIHTLAKRPRWDNTLFVLLSDHGDGLTDHPNVWRSTRHQTLLYESVVRVPLIFYCPAGGVGAVRVKRPVRLLDVMPTILDYVGAPVPDSLEGTTLLSAVRGDALEASLPNFFISETFGGGRDKSAVYSGEWMYVENRDFQAGCNELELQRIGMAANGKRTDQIKEHPAIAREMRDLLTQWQEEHPKAKGVFPGDAVTADPDRDAKMRALGYL